MRIGHQQRQAKVVQQALHRAFPVALAVSHLNQLAGKGHGVFTQGQRAAQRRAHGDLLTINVAASRFQTGDLGAQGIALQPPLLEGHAQFSQLVLHVVGALNRHVLQLPTALLLRQQVLRIGHLQQTEQAPQFVVAPGVGTAPLNFGLLARDLIANARDAVTAAGGNAQTKLALAALLAGFDRL